MRGVTKIIDEAGAVHVYACLEHVGSVDAVCHAYTNGWAVGLLEAQARRIITEALFTWWLSQDGGDERC